MRVILDDSIKDSLAEAPFDAVGKLSGTTFRDKENRRTFKTQLGQKNYFVKYHQGIGWKEILKECFQLRLPIVSAYNEYRVIVTLQHLGVPTTNPVGIGVMGANPASKKSFLITEALENTTTLKDVTERWPQQRPQFNFKLALIKQVAWIAHQMHSHGINHRDFYLCHFRINEDIVHTQDSQRIVLHLMDLHRAQMRAKVPARWQVKDLGALMFSAADIGLTRTDYFRFIKYYKQMPLREALRSDQNLWAKVCARAQRFYQRDWKRPMPTIF